MTVVLGIGVLYGILIITTFQRYGTVMDKAWKQRIDKWIEEKATGKVDSYAQPTPDDRPYYDSHRCHLDRPVATGDTHNVYLGPVNLIQNGASFLHKF
jgi:hypothetical protein